MTRVAGVVLAAGASRRLGTAKQLLVDETGQPLVARAAAQLLEAGCEPVVVVTGFAHADVAAAVAKLPVDVAFNDEWEEGIGASIRCAVKQLEGRSGTIIKAVLFTLCDVPSVSARHLGDIIASSSRLEVRVASEFRSDAGAVVRGIPALFPREDWPELRELGGDRGARDLLRAPGTSAVFLSGGGHDLDTPSDLDRWRRDG